MAVVVACAALALNACAATEWTSTLTIEDRSHVRVLASSQDPAAVACIARCLQPGDEHECLLQCPGKLVGSGPCPSDDGFHRWICADRVEQRNEERPGRCAEQLPVDPDVRLVRCTETATTPRSDARDGAAIAIVVLSIAALLWIGHEVSMFRT